VQLIATAGMLHQQKTALTRALSEPQSAENENDS